MVTRISGMVSGLDVDTLVKQMITAKRVPLDKLNQQKQILQWQRDNYREINSKLVDFQNSKLKNYDKSTALNTQTAVVTGNTTALKAEATADANGIPMKMEITELAKPRSWETVVPKKDGSIPSSATKLSAIADSASTTQTYNIVINGSSINFDKELSISGVIAKINSDSKANVTAKYDEVTGKFSLASKTYGDEGKVDLTGTNSLLVLFGSSDPDFKVTIPPEKAKITVNGTPMSFDSNNFKINGVSLTLLSKTDGSPTTINTQTDSAKALDTITSFVKDYNELLKVLNSKVDEEKYKDFTPLSDEQKKEMTDSDIELWEKKAKSGLLRNDEILKSTIASMRFELSNRMGELSSIGITAGQYYENGKLYIDEAKLKQAITDNPQKIMTLFQGGTGSDGLFDKLTTTVGNTLDKFVTKVGTSKFSSDLTIAFKSDSLMGKRLTDYNTRIKTLQTRLTTLETNYYKQFTAMETAMNKYNSQSSALSSYMAN